MFTKSLINVDFIEVVAKQTHIKYSYYTWIVAKIALVA